MHKPDFPLVPHSDAGDPDCCGYIVPDVRGDVADLVCNECGLVLEQDISREDFLDRIEAAIQSIDHRGCFKLLGQS